MRLVANELYYKEIKKAVGTRGAKSEEGIGAWAHELNKKMASLSAAEKQRCSVLADMWNKQGPPLEVKQKWVFSDRVLVFTLLTNSQNCPGEGWEIHLSCSKAA